MESRRERVKGQSSWFCPELTEGLDLGVPSLGPASAKGIGLNLQEVGGRGA